MAYSPKASCLKEYTPCENRAELATPHRLHIFVPQRNPGAHNNFMFISATQWQKPATDDGNFYSLWKPQSHRKPFFFRLALFICPTCRGFKQVSRAIFMLHSLPLLPGPIFRIFGLAFSFYQVSRQN